MMFKWFCNLNRERHYRECAEICEAVAYTRKNSRLLGAELNAIACRDAILRYVKQTEKEKEG